MNEYGLPQYAAANGSYSHSSQFQGRSAYSQHSQHSHSHSMAKPQQFASHSNRAAFSSNQPAMNSHTFRLSSTQNNQHNLGGQHLRNQENQALSMNQSNSLLVAPPKSPNVSSNHKSSSSANASKATSGSSIPRKSMRSSGLSFMSPVPPKYEQTVVASSSSQHHGNGNKLSVHGNGNQSMTLHDTHSMPISPIRPNTRNHEYLPHDQSLNLPLNTTQNTLNTLNLSNMASTTSMAGMNGAQFGNESRLSVHQLHGNEKEANVGNLAQVAIIGFPSGEAQFIHRKFRSYGTILRSEWKSNTLFVEYEHAQNARRALAENAKWIQHDNQHYMMAVMYAECTDLNPFDANYNEQLSKYEQQKAGGAGGRFLNLSGMYHNHKDGNMPQYFGQHHKNQIERAPAIQSGTKHIFWRIFHFVTSGW